MKNHKMTVELFVYALDKTILVDYIIKGYRFGDIVNELTISSTSSSNFSSFSFTSFRMVKRISVGIKKIYSLNIPH